MKKVLLIIAAITLTSCAQSNKKYVERLKAKRTNDSIMRVKDSLADAKFRSTLPYPAVGIWDTENNSGAWSAMNELKSMSNHDLVAQVKGARMRANRKNWIIVKSVDGYEVRYYFKRNEWKYWLVFKKQEAEDLLEEKLEAQRREYNSATYLLKERRK